MENNESQNKEQSIASYVSEKIKEGVSGDEIKKQLLAVGWSDDEIDQAYAKGLVQSGIPAPIKGGDKAPGKKPSVAEIVVNIFSFIVLGYVSISLGVLLFGVINHYFPDTRADSYAVVSSEAIFSSIATLLIGAPLYYFAMRFWFRKFTKDEGRVESRLTKWITHLVLLVASMVVVGSLISVLFNFLQGETSARFLLKALTIMVISGSVFGFYFLERKKVQYKKPVSRKNFQAFGIAAAVVILISIVLGFLVVGSPATERKRSFDDDRSDDLRSISACVDSYARKYNQLPDSLETLEDAGLYCSRKYKDPETEQSYEYRTVSTSEKSGGIVEGEFELCATFSLEADEDSVRKRDGYYRESVSKWEIHKAERTCFKEKVIMSGDGELKGCGY